VGDQGNRDLPSKGYTQEAGNPFIGRIRKTGQGPGSLPGFRGIYNLKMLSLDNPEQRKGFKVLGFNQGRSGAEKEKAKTGKGSFIHRVKLPENAG
jgi:hypothetical protein